MSQPNDVDREVDDRRPLPSYAWYLGFMFGSVAVLSLLLLFDLSEEFSIPRGAYALLAAAIVVFGAGYLVRSAEEQVARRIDRRAAADAQLFREIVEDVYSVAFTDAVAGAPGPRRIDSMNGRSKLPTHG